MKLVLLFFLLLLFLLYLDTNVMEKHNSKNMDLLSDIKMDPDGIETYKISFKIRIKHNQEAQLRKLLNYLQENNIVSADLFFQPDQCNDKYCKNEVDTSSVSHLLGVNNLLKSLKNLHLVENYKTSRN